VPLKINDYEIVEGLYYSRDHEWLRVEAEKCRIGITDYAQRSLHEIVFVDLPKAGIRVAQKQSIGTVESVKAVADIYVPISGEVLQVNENLTDSPELINQTPYDEGWIVIVRPSNLELELKTLLDFKTYAEYLRTLEKK